MIGVYSDAEMVNAIGCRCNAGEDRATLARKSSHKEAQKAQRVLAEIFALLFLQQCESIQTQSKC